MALAGRVAANTVIQVVTKIVTTGLSLIVIALTTRYLGRYGFGQYTIAITFVTFFSIAADLGLTLVTTQLISRPGANVSRVMSNLFSFRLISGFIIIGIAPLIVFLTPYDPVVKQGVGIAAIAFYFVLLSQIFVSLFQKELRTDKIAIAEVVSRIFVLALTMWAIASDFGVIGLLWIIAAGNAVSFVLHYIYAHRYAHISFVYDKAVWKDIIQRSWPLVITIVLNLVYLKADILILSLFKSQSDVGLYGAAYRVIDVLVTIPFMIGGTVLPIFAYRWQSNDKENYQRIWQRVFDVSAIMAWPLVIGGFMLADPIMNLVSGPGFAPAGSILKILIIAIGFIFFSAFFSYTMISFDKQRKLIGAYLLTAVTSLVLYFIFIPKFSYFAAAWITVYSEVLISILAWWIVKKSSGLQISFNRFFKALGAAFIMALVLLVFNFPTATTFGLLFAVITGVLIYFVSLYIIRGISKQDIIELLPSTWRS
jgi:O-antigen/teichoic acid export membrane protein